MELKTLMGYKFTECHKDSIYRYSLQAITDCPSDNTLIVIQCNPSIATKNNSDATAGKVAIWAEENMFHKVIFLNLFAYISPHISELKGKDYSLLVGPDNNLILKKHLTKYATVVLAWGGDMPVDDHVYIRRVNEIKAILDAKNITPHKVGALSYGTHPRHGRMWNKGNREITTLDWNKII